MSPLSCFYYEENGGKQGNEYKAANKVLEVSKREKQVSEDLRSKEKVKTGREDLWILRHTSH